MSVRLLRLQRHRRRITVRELDGTTWAQGQVGRRAVAFTTADDAAFDYRREDDGYRISAAGERLADFRCTTSRRGAPPRLTVQVGEARLSTVAHPEAGVRRILSASVAWGFELLDDAGTPRLTVARRRREFHLTTDIDPRIAVCLTTAWLIRQR